MPRWSPRPRAGDDPVRDSLDYLELTGELDRAAAPGARGRRGCGCAALLALVALASWLLLRPAA